jgi:hypothetical protein
MSNQKARARQVVAGCWLRSGGCALVSIAGAAAGSACLDWDEQIQQAAEAKSAVALTGSVVLPVDVWAPLQVEIWRLGPRGEELGDPTSTRPIDELGRFPVEVEAAEALRLQAEGSCLYPNGMAACRLEGYAVVRADAPRAHVNYLTHVVAGRVRRLLEEGQHDWAGAMEQAERELRWHLQLAGDTDALPRAYELGLDADSYPLAYLLAFTMAVSRAEPTSDPAPSQQEYLDALQADLADDGEIGPDLTRAFVTAQFELGRAQSWNAIEQSLASKSWSGASFNLREALDEDQDGVASAEDNCRYGANPEQAPLRAVCDFVRFVRPLESEDPDASFGVNAAIDLDNDGDIDLIDTKFATVFINDGTSRFSIKSFPAPYVGEDGPGTRFTTWFTAVGELTGDELPDIVYSGYTGQLLVLPGRGDGTFGDAQEVWSSEVNASEQLLSALVDADGDGKLDVMSLGFDAEGYIQLHCLLSRSSGQWPERVTHTHIRGEPRESLTYLDIRQPVAYGDFSGDGRMDIVAIVSSMESQNSVVELGIYYFEGHGDGVFNDGQRLDLTAGCSASLAAGDWDGDGHLDLAVLNASATELRLAFGGSEPVLSEETAIALPFEEQTSGQSGAVAEGCPGQSEVNLAMLPGHFSDKTAHDVLLQNHFVIVRERNAPRLQKLLYSGSSAAARATGDFNRDGHTDVISVGKDLTITLINAPENGRR